jgi:DNA replication protein DnaC
MSIIPNFSTIKCSNCDNNGFIVKNSVALECQCHIKYKQELKASNILLQSGLLNENNTYEDFKKLIDFDWSDYRGKDENGNLKKLQKFVDEFDSDKKPFKHLHCYVWGEQGTQKSYTMKGVLTKLATKGKSVYYIFAKDLIDLIFDSDRDENLNKKLNYIANVDVLVIDEFEEDRCCLWQSGFKEKLLIVWLKNRLEIIRKSTWLISNDTIEQQKESKFGELFGDLIDRETKYGRFEFKDRYVDNLSKEEIEEKLKSIWD